MADTQWFQVTSTNFGLSDGFGHIALNSLPNGVYVLQVQAQDTLHQTKLVIVKP